MHRGLIIVIVALLIGSGMAAPVAATDNSESATEDGLYVTVDETGDATITLVSTYELTDEAERDAFESLQEDADTQEEVRDRFTDRMIHVADEVGEDGSEVISEDSIEVQSEGDLGIVAVSITWEALATTTGENVVLSEPFDSGFESDQKLVVTASTNSTIEQASPDPDELNDSQAVWDAGAELSGFEVVFTLDDSESGQDATAGGGGGATSDSIPGFSVLTGALALLIGLGVAVLFARTRP